MIVPFGEKIIETKKCRISGQDFFVTDRDLEFYDKISPVFAGKKYPIPSPTLCPQERMKRRLAYRNQRHVYIRKSSYSAKTIFSMHSGDKTYPVYENEVYFSDLWDPKSFGYEYDFSRPFTEQMFAFINRVPHYARSITQLENSDYCNNANNLKDSYLSFNGGNSEKLLYTAMFKDCYECIDCLSVIACRSCFQCIECVNLEKSFYCQDCSRCTECLLCDGCSGCANCFSCTNLTNRQYYIANKQYSKEGYFAVLKNLQIPDVIRDVRTWISAQPKRYYKGLKNENVIGNNIINGKNIFHCFECSDCENLRYCDNIKTGKDCMDVSNFGWDPAWCYESCVVGHNANHILFSLDTYENVADVYYSFHCNRIHDCFCCTGLHSNEHHCVFNKPYSVQEYESLCGRIIEEMIAQSVWGEFPNIELSPWGYNETSAQEFFPETRESVLAKGWKWKEEEPLLVNPKITKPLHINQYNEKIVGYETAQKNIDDLLDSVIICDVTSRPFKVIKQELAFYIENSLPIPTKNPDQRHKERMNLRNPRTFLERTCSECGTDIITTYTPETSGKVLCEECYRKIVY